MCRATEPSGTMPVQAGQARADGPGSSRCRSCVRPWLARGMRALPSSEAPMHPRRIRRSVARPRV